jgi:serine/threonine protein kinase
MHNLGIAHRDLKSTNCLLEKLTTGEYTTYNIVICDFGLSIVDDQLLSSLKGQFKKSVMQGISFRYAAPEVFIRYGLIEKKTPETVDQAKMSDVYAFGIIIWELLERNIPWTTHSFQEVKEKVVNGERPPFMLRTGDSEETSRWSKAKILVSKQTLLRAQTLNAEDRIRRVLANLMTSCWVNDPSDRIPISKARADLIALTKKIRHVEDNNIILDE